MDDFVAIGSLRDVIFAEDEIFLILKDKVLPVAILDTNKKECCS